MRCFLTSDNTKIRASANLRKFCLLCADLVYNGGSYNGLCRIQVEAGGKIQTVSIPAAKAFDLPFLILGSLPPKANMTWTRHPCPAWLGLLPICQDGVVIGHRPTLMGFAHVTSRCWIVRNIACRDVICE